MQTYSLNRFFHIKPTVVALEPRISITTTVNNIYSKDPLKGLPKIIVLLTSSTAKAQEL